MNRDEIYDLAKLCYNIHNKSLGNISCEFEMNRYMYQQIWIRIVNTIIYHCNFKTENYSSSEEFLSDDEEEKRRNYDGH